MNRIEEMETMMASTYKVGIYCRLSKDDDIRERESASIAHQREMMQKYCAERGWHVEEIYVDDGFSGLNQNRPELQRLLSDVEAKKINLVITKDYSRLGRNARETEYLREDFFPRKGCRYVAMNDNIDTAYDDDFAPFKAIFNEHYSRDISKKVHSSYKNQAEKGVYTGTVAPFGYLKDPDKPGHLIIDPETVDAVKQIFTWAAEGHGVAYIKRRLESGKIACPTWWNRQRGLRNGYTRWERLDPENGRYVWDESVLKDMLVNPIYYGAVASQKVNYRFKLGVINEKKPKDWIIVENMHEPIVDKKTFDIVQHKIESRKCTRGDGTYSLFAGLIKCGECGKALTIRSTHAKHPIDIYACVTYNRHGKNHCTQHRVPFEELYDICLTEIRELARKTVDADELEQYLQQACQAEQKEQLAIKQKEVTKAKDRLETIDRLISKLYEDLLAGKITEEIFDNMMAKATAEQGELKEQIRLSAEESLVEQEVGEDAAKWTEMISQYTDIKELDAEMLNRLIKQIVVHESIDEDGTRNITLEIHYNFRPVDDTNTHTIHDNFTRGESSPLAI